MATSTATRKARAAAAPASRAKKTAAMPPVAEPPPERYKVIVQYVPKTGDGLPGRLDTLTMEIDDRSFYPDVQRWRYVVANRLRLTRATRDTIGEDLAQWMAVQCQVSPEDMTRHVKAMAGAGRVEVVIPFSHTRDQAWAARLFPWETILALLTRASRDESQSFTVMRHLKVDDKKKLPEPTPASLLVVRSGPGEIARHFDLERECAMVTETLRQLEGFVVERLNEPDREQLGAKIRNLSPSIVHLAGVDPYALQKLNLQSIEPDNTDGFVLRRAERGFDTVAPQEMGPLLTAAAAAAPLLVCASACFSASRLCALAVAAGARYAIGFFDNVTDTDAMLFFGSFYREWMQDWDVLRAFEQARGAWQAQLAGAQHTGVVLWSRHSLVAPLATMTTAQPSPSVTPQPQATVEDLKFSAELHKDLDSGGVRVSRTSLNYSLLHNDRSPFRTFFVDKPYSGKLPPLQVEVVLEVGRDSCRCRFSVELPEASKGIELAPRIRLPLVAGLLRQCTESLRTNLYVNVRCGERLLLESSERVTVLPADEWRDDGEDHLWLPSFVLPRDPAVLKVVGSAQRYLRTLLDDCTAGFDGYQQLADDDTNAAAVVDPQVQAIWAALQHDLPLNYINPPPSYTSRSQRLRTPSEIFRGQAATCIDLALLFASCLEFVGIYPVLFLIEGHAFPGYWRSDKAWWRMKQFHFDASSPNTAAAAIPPLPDATGISSGQSESWMFDGVGNLVELLRYVQEASLVPFESTFVAAQRGFYSSLEEGSARLHPDTFDAMIDIQSARSANVTPLPLFDKFE